MRLITGEGRTLQKKIYSVNMQRCVPQPITHSVTFQLVVLTKNENLSTSKTQHGSNSTLHPPIGPMDPSTKILMFYYSRVKTTPQNRPCLAAELSIEYDISHIVLTLWK